MSKGIKQSSKRKLELYKETLRPNITDDTRQKYKNYRNMYNRLKHTSMLTYYRNKVTESRTNTKKLWRVIKNIIGKNKHGGSIIPYIIMDGIWKYDPCEIANEFGSFYSQLGLKLAKQIQPGSKTIDHYISKIPKSINSLALHSMTPN